MRRIAALALIVACATACGEDPPQPPKSFTVSGQMSAPLRVGDLGWPDEPGDPCQPGGGYTDIHEGAQVVISDAAGKTIAVGSLASGLRDNEGRACFFSFTVPDVPSGEKFYGIEVSHRGRLQYPAARVTQPLILTLSS